MPSSSAASAISKPGSKRVGRTPAQSDLAEMDALWDEAKAIERA